MHITSDENVLIELAPNEWAVALDALERVQADYGNGYSAAMRQALARAVRKVQDARDQLTKSNRARAEINNGRAS